MRDPKKSRIRRERNAFFVLLGFAIVALVLPLPYMTVTASPNATPVFDRVDRNRDGYISFKEASSVRGLPAVFGRVDRNADGRVDRVEYAKW